MDEEKKKRQKERENIHGSFNVQGKGKWVSRLVKYCVRQGVVGRRSKKALLTICLPLPFSLSRFRLRASPFNQHIIEKAFFKYTHRSSCNSLSPFCC